MVRRHLPSPVPQMSPRCPVSYDAKMSRFLSEVRPNRNTTHTKFIRFFLAIFILADSPEEMLKSLCSPKRATTTPNFWDRVFQSKTSLPKEELIRDLCQHGTTEIVHHFEEVDELLLHHFPKEISCLVRVYLEWILTLQHFQDFFAHLIQSYKNFPYVSREQVERVWPGDSIPFYSVLEEWFRTYKYAKENSSVIEMNNEPHFDSAAGGHLDFSYQHPITDHGFWIGIAGQENKKAMYINNLRCLYAGSETLFHFLSFGMGGFILSWTNPFTNGLHSWGFLFWKQGTLFI